MNIFKGNNNVATMLVKTLHTVIKIPLVNLIAIDLILFVKDLAKTFEAFVRFNNVKMLSIKKC